MNSLFLSFILDYACPQLKNIPQKIITSHRIDAHGAQHGAKYHCPISTLEMNGRLKFGYILSSGMVISDRAIQQLKEDNMIIGKFSLYSSYLIRLT